MATISTSEFKNGMFIKMDGHIWQIVRSQHVKMQQRAPIVKTKLRRLHDGAALERNFRGGDKFEEAFVEQKAYQYLYQEQGTYHLMDKQSYEQIEVPQEMISDQKNYIRENDTIYADFCDGKIVGFSLPASVVLKVAQAEPGMRGDTATSTLKPATLETGLVTQVPLFVNPGDMIKVDTASGDYISREGRA